MLVLTLASEWALTRTLLSSTLTKFISKLARHIYHLVNITIKVSLRVLHALIDNSDDGLWSLFWVGDLQESVLMALSLFASGAVVEVLANATLVPDTDDWSNTTTITLHSLMDNQRRLLLVFGNTRRRNLLVLPSSLRVVVELIEYLTALLVKLFLDKLLKSFSRKS